MRNKLWVLAAIAVGVVAVGAASVAVSGSDAKAAVKTRMIYMSAVEWKGSATVSKEAFPTSPLPKGGGYELYPAGSEKAVDETGDPNKWLAETYRFDTGVVVACKGERVVLKIFGVNAKEHHIMLPAFNKDFTVYRGRLATSVFKVKETGIFPIICITHQPAHRAELLVVDC